MIAFATLLRKPTTPKRRVFAGGRIYSVKTIHAMRHAAARLRNESTLALIAGNRNAAQARLSEAEALEIELGRTEHRHAVAMDDILFLLGSQ